jgi:hypothetical protein
MSSYLKLVDQIRIKNYLGMEMAEGHELRRPKSVSRGYAYVEVPVLGFLDKDGELVQEAKKGSHIQVVPACTVDVRGSYRFEVHPSRALLEYGMSSGMFYLEPDSSKGRHSPSIYVTLRKDISVQDLDYAIRIYMRD